MAEKLDYFKSPLESGLKVANTGKKTFRYENENGSSTEVSFNYSTNKPLNNCWTGSSRSLRQSMRISSLIAPCVTTSLV